MRSTLASALPKGCFGEPVHIFQELFAHLVAELRLRDLRAVLVEFLVLAALADLVLQDLDLLAQDKILLNFAHTGADLALDILLHRGHVDLSAQDLIHALKTRQRAQLIQNVLLVLITQVELLGDKIGKIARVVRTENGGIDLVGEFLCDLGVFGEIGIGLAKHRLGALAVARECWRLVDELRLRLQKRLALPKALQTGTARPLHHHAQHAVRYAQYLRHARDCADLVKVLFLRQFHAQFALRDEEDLFPVLHGALQRAHGNFTLKVKAGVHAREHIEPAHAR